MAGKRRQALDDRLTARRQGARVARLFNRLHAHANAVRSITSCTYGGEPEPRGHLLSDLVLTIIGKRTFLDRVGIFA